MLALIAINVLVHSNVPIITLITYLMYTLNYHAYNLSHVFQLLLEGDD